MSAVTASFTVQGDVASFDSEGFRDALLARFTDAEDVTLVVTSASIIVEATIVMRDESAAQSAATAISTTNMADMERDWFANVGGGTGLSIAAVSAAAVASVLVVAPSPPTATPAAPLQVLSGGQKLGAQAAADDREGKDSMPSRVLVTICTVGGAVVVLLAAIVAFICARRRCAKRGRLGVRRASRNSRPWPSREDTLPSTTTKKRSASPLGGSGRTRVMSASEAPFAIKAKTSMFHADEVSATIADPVDVHDYVEAHVIAVSKATSTTATGGGKAKVEAQMYDFNVDEVSATIGADLTGSQQNDYV
jgi:hypothetical protein